MIKKESFKIGHIPAVLWGLPSQALCLYLHGQGGSKEEAGNIAEAAVKHGYQVLSVDLPEHGERSGEADCFDPWHVIPELNAVMAYAKGRWNRLILFAVSIGAWFSLLGLEQEPLARCFFLSPVPDMRRLISQMMVWAEVSEARLQQEQSIQTDFGQTLSWPYWQYVLAHPLEAWPIPTEILYGELDELIDLETVKQFAGRYNCRLTIAENCGHWFHTPRELNALGRWLDEGLSAMGGEE